MVIRVFSRLRPVIVFKEIDHVVENRKGILCQIEIIKALMKNKLYYK